jgi:hypothetical protein
MILDSVLNSTLITCASLSSRQTQLNTCHLEKRSHLPNIPMSKNHVKYGSQTTGPAEPVHITV